MPCLPAEPKHHVGILVAGQVVPYEEHAQRRKFDGQGEASRQPVLPSLPGGTGHRRVGWRGLRRQGHHDLGQPRLEPAMQDRVGAAADRLEVHLSGRGREQGQDLARAAPDILVRLGGGAALRSPTAARVRHRLERAGLVLAPDRQAEGGAERVGPLDQPLLAAASGSMMVTRPSLVLALAHDHTSLAPAPPLLPAEASAVQGATECVGADAGKAIIRPTQSIP